MAITVKHAKTNTIPAWTQADLDAQIALGNYPPGTLLADITLSTDWNSDHTFTGTLDQTQNNVAVDGVTVTGNGTPGSPLVATGGGSATPGGSNTQVQFNDSGAFGGDSNFTFDKTTANLSVANNVAAGNYLVGAAGAYLGSCQIVNTGVDLQFIHPASQGFEFYNAAGSTKLFDIDGNGLISGDRFYSNTSDTSFPNGYNSNLKLESNTPAIYWKGPVYGFQWGLSGPTLMLGANTFGGSVTPVLSIDNTTGSATFAGPMYGNYIALNTGGTIPDPYTPLFVRLNQNAPTKIVLQNSNGSGQEVMVFAGSASQWNFGQDNGAGILKFSNDVNGSLNVNTRFQVDGAGNGTFGGNLNLLTTTSSVGAITQNGNRFVHSYGTSNFFAGEQAGNFTLTGAECTGVGFQALTANTSGSANSAFGTYALISNTTGQYNAAFGRAVLYANTTGSFNVGMGTNTLLSNTTGSSNVAIAQDALGSNTTGQQNVGIGDSSLYSNISGSYNTGVGRGSMVLNTTGSENTAIGHNAGLTLTTGTNNVFIGSMSDTTVANVTNTVALGYGATVTASNQMVLGNSSHIPIIPKLSGTGTRMVVADPAGVLSTQTIPSGSAFTWTTVTGTSQAAAVNNGYIANNASLVTVTLPATAAVGDVVIVTGLGAGLFKVAQNSGQSIRAGNVTTTTGTGGYLQATDAGDDIELLCVVANTTWKTRSITGNPTII